MSSQASVAQNGKGLCAPRFADTWSPSLRLIRNYQTVSLGNPLSSDSATLCLRMCHLEHKRHEGTRRLMPHGSGTEIQSRPRTWLTPVTLVLLREESSYGYEIIERLEQFGFEQIR